MSDEASVKPDARVRSNLAIRLTTAAVVSPLLLWLLFWGPAWGWFLMIWAATGLAAFEVFSMTHPRDPVSRGIGVVTSLAVCGVVYFYTSDARVLLTLVFVTTLVGMFVPLWRLGEVHEAGHRMMAGIAVPWYIALLGSLALIRRDMGEQGAGYVLMTLMFAWMADTGGFFAGRSFGKHRLYPKVSPNKTWEGFAGALVGAAFGAALAHFWYLPAIPLAHALLLAVVAGGLGQLGDLTESLLKRATDVKDSGNIIPGHGGLLDRVDALLVASSVVYLYVMWIGKGT